MKKEIYWKARIYVIKFGQTLITSNRRVFRTF